MKGLVCKICGYITLDNNEKQCPICHAKNIFEEKEDAYKMSNSEAASSESKKKHIPYFNIIKECVLIPNTKCTDIYVKIGEILHPALQEHYITNITFYTNNKFVSYITFTFDVNPAAVIHLKDEVKGKVQVIANCSIHGKWFNEVKI
ncbi:MAG: hypothetical protein LBL77_02910 [Endomicrobium sp.]|jgi:superoxide reductase|nr:hypothetical protein [Endomicrobium sp.]